MSAAKKVAINEISHFRQKNNTLCVKRFFFCVKQNFFCKKALDKTEKRPASALKQLFPFEEVIPNKLLHCGKLTFRYGYAAVAQH